MESYAQKSNWSRSSEIFGNMSEEWGGSISAGALYTFVSGNRYGVRILLGEQAIPPAQLSGTPSKSSSQTSLTNHSESAHGRDSASDGADGVSLNVAISADQWNSLLTEKLYKWKGTSGQPCHKRRIVLKPGQNIITTRIWEETRLECGFNALNHYVGVESKYINGKFQMLSFVSSGIS